MLMTLFSSQDAALFQTTDRSGYQPGLGAALTPHPFQMFGLLCHFNKSLSFSAAVELQDSVASASKNISRVILQVDAEQQTRLLTSNSPFL